MGWSEAIQTQDGSAGLDQLISRGTAHGAETNHDHVKRIKQHVAKVADNTELDLPAPELLRGRFGCRPVMITRRYRASGGVP